jgi:hypothetical protein
MFPPRSGGEMMMPHVVTDEFLIHIMQTAIYERKNNSLAERQKFLLLLRHFNHLAMKNFLFDSPFPPQIGDQTPPMFFSSDEENNDVDDGDEEDEDLEGEVVDLLSNCCDLDCKEGCEEVECGENCSLPSSLTVECTSPACTPLVDDHNHDEHSHPHKHSCLFHSSIFSFPSIFSFDPNNSSIH